MAAGVVTNFHCRAPVPAYLPLIFQQVSPRKEDEEMLEEKPEAREEEGDGGGDEEEDEEEEVDEESEAPEDEEDGLDGAFFDPASCALDVTKQLLRFADLISHDIQRYFGRCSDDQEACDIYSDSVSITTGGRLRYYDDLLKIARAGSPKAPESSGGASAGDDAAGGLGPLAELFAHRGPSQGRGRPMTKRHLPLSFWTEPIPCCAVDSISSTADITQARRDTPSQDGTRADANADADADAHAHYGALQQHNTHGLDNTQLDFSDLLAYWDPNPEFTHTLTENTHMQH